MSLLHSFLLLSTHLFILSLSLKTNLIITISYNDSITILIVIVILNTIRIFDLLIVNSLFKYSSSFIFSSTSLLILIKFITYLYFNLM
jgi:hypothetical protein